jgi:hypothetical protein
MCLLACFNAFFAAGSLSMQVGDDEFDPALASPCRFSPLSIDDAFLSSDSFVTQASLEEKFEEEVKNMPLGYEVVERLYNNQPVIRRMLPHCWFEGQERIFVSDVLRLDSIVDKVMSFLFTIKIGHVVDETWDNCDTNTTTEVVRHPDPVGEPSYGPPETVSIVQRQPPRVNPLLDVETRVPERCKQHPARK